MSEFKAGQRVRITEHYLKSYGTYPSDGSLEAVVGTEGTVIGDTPNFIEVKRDKPTLPGLNDLYSPQELELV